MHVAYASETASTQGDPNWFTGAVRLQSLVASSGGPPVKVFRVQFVAGARTNWHVHSGEQILVVIQGRCRVQERGQPVFELATGDAVSIPAGAEHWHGASLGGPMVHLAINVNL